MFSSVCIRALTHGLRQGEPVGLEAQRKWRPIAIA